MSSRAPSFSSSHATGRVPPVRRFLFHPLGKAILEAQLRGDQELPPEYDSDESIDYLPESPPRKHVHYGEPGYRTRYQ
ncbi:hypothetical protein C2845_PM16G01410 [Panicum miliaceum]|uniref:Uncharacterized protein n=1 Tax=Panicum miliaceum TaxID=4540 RepID=A0A3L6PYB7_PANMI|nr:hypothetical protein C2845_PM16G01410 [Panicum miliaceum]